jgi:hypothetical protein
MLNKTILFFSFIVITSAFAYAGGEDSLDNHVFQGTIQPGFSRLNVLYDPDLSIRVGAEDILTMHYGITRGEDKLLGTSWFAEQTVLGKTGGILLRTAKYTFLDLPLDVCSFIFAHEYFGHGGHIRELGFNDILFHFNMPPPYGHGSAFTQFYPNPFSLSTPEYLSIYEGGIESQTILGRTIALRWMATGEINYRDADLYLLSLWGNMSYIQSTSNEISTPGSDPELYLKSLNAQCGFTDVKNLKMTVAAFKSKMKLSLANPFYYFSMYYFLKTYLWDGNTASVFPTFHFGRVRYLPVLRSGMTPFGPDYHLENYLRFGETTSLIDIRVGDQTFYSSWGGIGFTFLKISTWGKCSADANVNIWKQPDMILGGTPGSAKGGGFGGAFSVRGYYDFSESNNSFSAAVELGYKSVGFLEGYSLNASPIIIIGLGYRL